MFSGKRQVSTTLFALAGLLAATGAGRVGEDGSGAMWIAPELVQAVEPPRRCGHPVRMNAGELVFEYVDGGIEEVDVAREVAATTRKGVTFEWNPETGELGLGATTQASLFADVEPALARPSQLARSCGPPP